VSEYEEEKAGGGGTATGSMEESEGAQQSKGIAPKGSKNMHEEVGVEKDNEEQVLVKKKWLEVKKVRVAEVIIEGVDLLNKVRKCKVRDDKVVKAVKEMK